MQGQKSLMLCWCSSPRLGREHVTMVFATEGSRYLLYRCLQPIAAKVLHDAKPKLIETTLMLIITMGQWRCRFLFCVKRLPIHRSCTTVTKSLLKCQTFKIKSHCYSIYPYFSELSTQYLPPSMIGFIIISTHWLPEWQIQTWPFGNAESTNSLALVAHIVLQFMHQAKWFILPTALLFVIQYSYATA
jgi:hypothetical protein